MFLVVSGNRVYQELTPNVLQTLSGCVVSYSLRVLNFRGREEFFSESCWLLMMRIFSLFLLFATLAITPDDSRAQSQIGNLTNINLEQYGWQAPPSNSTREWSGVTRQILAIDHKGNIFVGFTARKHEGLATREAPSLSFHILRITSDGRPDRSLSIPTSRWFDNGLYLDSQDHILVRANDALQALSINYELAVSSVDRQVLASCSTYCSIKQSASRGAMVLQDGYGDHGLTYLDTAIWPPNVIASCAPTNPYYEHTITEKFAYSMYEESRDDSFFNRWPFCEYKNATRISITTAGAVYALNEERFVRVDHDAIEVLANDGHRQFLRHMVKNDVPSNEVSASENGNRFAVQIITFRGSSTALDIGGHVAVRRIVVYDSATGKEILSCPVKKTHHYVFDFYLSPDGHQLALLEDGVLSVRNVE
jgi:hypothetical protein